MSNLILIVGGTGQGKSFLLNKSLLGNEIRKDMTGKDFYTTGHRSKNQYVFDLNNEYRLPTDETIRPKMRHIKCDVKIFTANCKRLQNTNIVFEDATGFLRGKQSAEFSRLMVQRRHSKNNYIILFHSLNRVPPELMEYCNFLILFKTGDNFKTIEQKFNNPALNEMFLTVSKAKDRTFISKKFL